MKRNPSVQEQNASTRALIREEALRPLDEWLPLILSSHKLEAADGILIRGNWVPTPDYMFTGCWLTRDQRFWEFEYLVDSITGELIAVEKFVDVTDTTNVSRHNPGYGMSYERLALDVLAELRGSPQLVATERIEPRLTKVGAGRDR